MNGRVRVLCRPALAAGFRLAGVRPDLAADPAEGARRLVALVEEPEVGVVLVQDDFHGMLHERERRRLARRPRPLVVPFPAPSRAGGPGPESFIADLLRQAVGYRVRLG